MNIAAPSKCSLRGWHVLAILVGFFLTGWTVYYWNGVYVLFMFLLGSGAWIRDLPAGEAGPGSRRPPRRQRESGR